MPRPPADTPTPDTRNGIAAQAERRQRARDALVRVRQRLSWQAARELQRRLSLRPETLEPRDLVAIAKLEQSDQPKTLTLSGDPARPLVIGLEPAETARARAARLAAPDPPALPDGGAHNLTDARGQLRPMRLSFTGPAVPVKPEAP